MPIEELTYGQKLIAEAIEAHFGERVVDYDEDVDDTSNHDAWQAFDAMFAAHPTPTAADRVERLTAELERTKQQRQMLQGNVEDLERSAEQREAALLKMRAGLAEDRKSAIDALSAQEEQIERLREALKPFAAFAPNVEQYVEGRATFGGSPIMPTKHFRLADFQRAAAALEWSKRDG